MPQPIRPHRPYPITVKLRGDRAATIRVMAPADASKILNFAAQLPADDLLFLRTDITSPQVVRAWIEAIAEGHTITLIAEIDGEVAGYASIHLDQAKWTRRVGEIRVNSLARYRGLGLGRRLTSEVFDLAQSIGLKKITAQMTPDQAAARAAFERLGFQVEAVLTDWVEDRDGHPRDMMIMTHDVDGFSDQLTA